MSIWVKLLIAAWLYLSVGVGVVLFSQVVAHKIEKMDDYDCYIDLKIDPDDEEFSVEFACNALFWPVSFVAIVITLIAIPLRLLVKRIWEEHDEDNRRW